MKEVKLSKEWLLTKLKENREKHERDYVDAVAGWRTETKEAMYDALDTLTKGVSTSDVQLHFDSCPTSHLKEYDRVIMMVDNHLEHEITLDQHEFQMYVMDDWEWKMRWEANNTKYVSATRGTF